MEEVFSVRSCAAGAASFLESLVPSVQHETWLFSTVQWGCSGFLVLASHAFPLL